MRNPKLVTLALSATALASAVLAAPAASAADVLSGSTDVTFELTGSPLTINTGDNTTPTPLTTGSGALQLDGGNTVSGSLPEATVVDGRGTLLHTMKVTMTSTDFVLQGSLPAGATAENTTITKDNLEASTTGIPAITGGVGVPTSAALSGSLAGGADIVRVDGIVGSIQVVYTPTVTVTVPAGKAAGTYKGTVTQTVS